MHNKLAAITAIPTTEGLFALGDLSLQSGETLTQAKLAYKTWGTLNPAKSNAILYPTCYTSTHKDQDWPITQGGILDPTKYFIITPNLFANGLSSSPANHPNFPPLVTVTDNINAQKTFLTETYGLKTLACVYGFSMGAQQAYHWAALFPDMVQTAAIVCGTAKTSPHNQVFLEGLLAILEAAPEHQGNGRFSSEPHAAIRAFARIYAGWCMSQDWYRANLHLATATSLADFLDREWQPGFSAFTAPNLYAQAKTWLHADISANHLHNHNLPAALNAITATILLLPSTTDLYFRVADNQAELPHLRKAILSPIPSIHGHAAGAPSTLHTEQRLIRQAVHALLGDSSQKP